MSEQSSRKEISLCLSYDPTKRLLGRFGISLFNSAHLQAQKDRAEQAERQLEFDMLTGAGSRYAFMRDYQRLYDRVVMQGEADSSMALMLIDVDGMKRVNDREGHPEGDRLLVTVRDSLHAHVRPTDHIYRVGGDEFAVLMPNFQYDGDNDFRADRTSHALSEDIKSAGFPHDLRLGATVATGILMPGEGPNEFYGRVDMTLIGIKRLMREDPSYRILCSQDDRLLPPAE